MTRKMYKDEILGLRTELQNTGRDYLHQFLAYWFPNIEGDTYDRYRRDLQSFLRGSGFIHAYAEPYAFLPKINNFLRDHEARQRQAQERTEIKESY